MLGGFQPRWVPVRGPTWLQSCQCTMFHWCLLLTASFAPFRANQRSRRPNADTIKLADLKPAAHLDPAHARPKENTSMKERWRMHGWHGSLWTPWTLLWGVFNGGRIVASAAVRKLPRERWFRRRLLPVRLEVRGTGMRLRAAMSKAAVSKARSDDVKARARKSAKAAAKFIDSQPQEKRAWQEAELRCFWKCKKYIRK
eukprot:Skav219400  [mRNA]  locus=scaffold1139:16534:23644:+ [translate_table: standard]